MKYDFTVYLQGTPELTDEMADALFEAGCDDGSPGSCERVVSIDFHREAKSLDEAVRTAVANIEAAGYAIDRVEIEAEGIAALKIPAA